MYDHGAESGDAPLDAREPSATPGERACVSARPQDSWRSRWLVPPVCALAVVATVVGMLPSTDPASAVSEIIRMAGPVAVQSWMTGTVTVLLLIGAYAPRRWRITYVAVASLLLIASWIWAPLPIRASVEVDDWMGDYNTYTEDRAHFEDYFGGDVVRFHFHLGAFVINAFDRLLGRTDASMHSAFVLTSWTAGLLMLAGWWLVGSVERWSTDAMRYLALIAMAPLMLFYFGYRELGYLSLGPAMFPLLIRGVCGRAAVRQRCLTASAIGHGLRAALHGFGLVSLGAAVVATLAAGQPLRRRIEHAGIVATWGVAAYTGWLLVYLIGLGRSIVPGHASGIPFRHLASSYVAEHRLVAPLLSATGLRDVGLEALIVGVPVLILGIIAAPRSGEKRVAVSYALASVAFLVLFWPVQGIAAETDLVVAAFGGFFAGAWLCARSGWATIAGAISLFIAHAVFWFVVRNEAFLNSTTS